MFLWGGCWVLWVEVVVVALWWLGFVDCARLLLVVLGFCWVVLPRCAVVMSGGEFWD